VSVLACSPEPTHLADAPLPASPEARPASPPTLPAPDPIDLPPIEPSARAIDEPVATPEPESATPPEPADPLAPILPDGPEPGSPEADEELAKLLDESSITQEEFDKAFRGGGPNIQGDEFVFGPGERSRDTPVLEIGKLRVESGSVSAADLDAIVRADENDLLACHAVALMDDPTSKGSVELRVELDATGSKSTVTAAGGEALAPALTSCLITVAEAWRPKGAGKAKFAVPLELSTR
jgi:hypothetical protein